MLGILSTTAPIFILIALGYIAVRSRLFPAEDAHGLGRFVLYFALPSLIFTTITQMEFSEVIDPSYLTVYGLGSILSFLIGLSVSKFIFADSLARGGIKGIGMAASNSAFFGYPVLLLTFDHPPTNAFAMCVMIENVVILPLALMAIEYSAGRSNGTGLASALASMASRVARNPLVIAIVSGIAISAAGLDIPDVIDKSLDMLGRTSAAVALFVVGASLVGNSVRGNIGEIGMVAIGKLAVHPLMMVLLIWLLPDFDPDLQKAAILMAAMPMMSVYPIIGSGYGFRNLCSSILVVATLSSFVTISVVMGLLF